VMRSRPVGSWWLIIIWPIVATLASEPGRLNADTKYDLVGDPGRLMRVALSTWDETRLGGWIPQQYAGYLWPSGPFHWLAQPLPDWVAQRLWLATLVIVAGLGVRAAARHLGCGVGAATVAGVVYQISPYTLPYLSRTSAMLLPWALCGWILVAAILATRRPAPRWIAVLALLFATAGGVNSTALLMISPLPVLWFISAARTGDMSWRRAVGLSVATAVSSAVAGAWLVASAVIGATHGPDLLGFSEDITDVAATSSAPEVLRSAGYWLTYAVEPTGVATTANAMSLTGSWWVVLSTFTLAVVGLAASVAGRWRYQWFAAAAVLVSVLVAVGVHPIGDPSPMGRLLLDDVGAGTLTALRSSTRALPILSMITAIGVARACSRLRPRPIVILGGLVVAAIAAPWWSLARVVDPALDRPATPPPTWEPLLAAVQDAERVLVVPGTEFSTFTWGHTQDPPWTSTTPVITRELLPLGTPERMDLLYALDDAVQEATAQPSAIVAAATWLGADRLWVATDVDTDRYGTASLDPAVVYHADGLSVRAETAAGAVFDVVVGAAPSGGVVELWGRGRGALTAASAGIVDGNTVIVPPGSPVDAPAVVTDGDREVLRHWRGSQATVGAVSVDADARRTDTASLGIADPERTIAVLDRGLSVSASAYGDPIRLLPEVRPAMALDGDPATAWRVAMPADEVELSVHGRVGDLAPVVVTDGIVGRVVVSISGDPRDGVEPTVVERTPDVDGSIGVIEVPDADVRVTITLDDIAVGTSVVGLSEVTVTPAPEFLRLPTITSTDATVVMERWRHGRTDTGRSDPEPVMRREVVTEVDLISSVRIDVGDRRPVTPGECITGVLSIDGVDIGIDPATGGHCDGVPVRLDAGVHRIESLADIVVMAPVVVPDRGCCIATSPRAHTDVMTARVDGRDVDTFALVGGGTAVVNDRVDDAAAIEFGWLPDRGYTAALVVSAVAALLAVLVIVIDPGGLPARVRRRHLIRPRWVRAVVTGAVVAATVSPVAGVVCALGVMVLPAPSSWAMALVGASGAVIVAEVISDGPALSSAWPGHFGVLHVPVLAAVVAACVVVLIDEERA